MQHKKLIRLIIATAALITIGIAAFEYMKKINVESLTVQKLLS